MSEIVLPDDPGFGPEVQVDYPGYRSTRLRAPTRPLVTLPEELHPLDGPVFGEDAIGELDGDLTRQHAGEPLGERIVVSGRVLDEDGRPIRRRPRRGLAGERGRPLPARGRPASGAARPELLRRRQGAAPTTTATTGSSRSSRAPTRGATTRTRGDRRTSTSRCSGRAFTQRLVTQMYFPGDPLFAYDPIFHSVRDPKARELLISRFDLATTTPDWALAYRWDIVLGRGGGGTTPLEEPHRDAGRRRRPSARSTRSGSAGEPRTSSSRRTTRRRSCCTASSSTATASPITDGMIEVWDPVERLWGRCGTHPPTASGGAFSFVVPKPAARAGQAPHLEVYVFARGLLQAPAGHGCTSRTSRRRTPPTPSSPALDEADRSRLVATREDGACASTSTCRARARRSSSRREPVLGDLRPRRPGGRALRPRLARRDARRGAGARRRGRRWRASSPPPRPTSWAPPAGRALRHR